MYVLTGMYLESDALYGERAEAMYGYALIFYFNIKTDPPYFVFNVLTARR